MTREKFRELLRANGYTKMYTSQEELRDFPNSWDSVHNGCLYKRFDETEVAFGVEENNNVWLSIQCQDACLEWDVKDLTVVNIFLTAFHADTLKGLKYNERVD